MRLESRGSAISERSPARWVLMPLLLVASLSSPLPQSPPASAQETSARQTAETSAAEGEGDAASRRGCLYYLISYAPLLVLFGLIAWFFLPYRRVMQRSMAHMEALERLTQEVVDALKRIEEKLDRE